MPLTRLAEALVLDRTTLTRNLAPLERDDLIRIDIGEDRRARIVAITPAGRRALARALPLWRVVQGRVVGALGEPVWRGLMSNLGRATDVAQAQ